MPFTIMINHFVQLNQRNWVPCAGLFLLSYWHLFYLLSIWSYTVHPVHVGTAVTIPYVRFAWACCMIFEKCEGVMSEALIWLIIGRLILSCQPQFLIIYCNCPKNPRRLQYFNCYHPESDWFWISQSVRIEIYHEPTWRLRILGRRRKNTGR